ncbi:hypothetical protein F4776DRAFT_659891 [Hypoxylon sp. NC0597]|nr:hypothetical protein F4776DRAFT_659891 [Hypoxylon sp. NC0597]
MSRSTNSRSRPLAQHLPSPTSSPASSSSLTRIIAMSLVAVEVTSPDTIVVARESELPQSSQPPPVLICEGPDIYVRKGQKFDITIEIDPDDDDLEGSKTYGTGQIEPMAEIDIKYEESEGFSEKVQAISNSPVNITLSAGKTYGLEATGGNILDLSRVELSEVAIHDSGHYFLHLVIEEVEIENGQEVPEILAQITTRKIQVSE